jgi:hypothetical protein
MNSRMKLLRMLESERVGGASMTVARFENKKVWVWKGYSYLFIYMMNVGMNVGSNLTSKDH